MITQTNHAQDLFHQQEINVKNRKGKQGETSKYIPKENSKVEVTPSDDETDPYIDEESRGKNDDNSINEGDLPPNEIEVCTIEENEVNIVEKQTGYEESSTNEKSPDNYSISHLQREGKGTNTKAFKAEHT